MNTTGINELEAVYEAAMKIITGPFSDNFYREKSLQKIFAPSFLAYGLAEDEKYMNLSDFMKLVDKHRKKSKHSDMNMSINSTPVFRSYSADLQSAVYVDELQWLTIEGENSQTIHIRASIVLFKVKQGWRVTHFHASAPSFYGHKANEFPQQEREKRWKKEKNEEGGTAGLKEALEKLAANQAQLVRLEKLASLGQLTAGIAHEIKNPLNFINNFSELSSEFLEEIEENVQKLEPGETTQEILSLLEDVKGNLHKIHHHGTRADGIVKSMLLHSRGGNGKMENTDLNALIREYVNLSFHGMRANKNPINVDIKIETEEALQPVKLNAENFSRVILNLCKNAFDAMREKQEHQPDKNYLPKLILRTKTAGDEVWVEIEDNGPGVPKEIREKMMLPFFTTKKGSEGTGLGLSISQDIIKSHNGILEVDSKEGKYTLFRIKLKRDTDTTL